MHLIMNVRAFRLGPSEIGRKAVATILCSLVLIAAGLFLRYPGSTPNDWQQFNGTVSGTLAKGNGASKQYYPVVQYLALGYSHEVNAKRSYSYAPDFGASFKVAFDPGDPEDAVLLNDTKPNYFQLLPWLGLALPTIVFAAPKLVRWYSVRTLKAYEVQKHQASTPPRPKEPVDVPEKKPVAPEPEQKVIVTATPELQVPAAVPTLAFVGPRESLANKSKQS